MIEAEQNTETSPGAIENLMTFCIVVSAEASENVEQVEETQDVAEVTLYGIESETVTPGPVAKRTSDAVFCRSLIQVKDAAGKTLSTGNKKQVARHSIFQNCAIQRFRCARGRINDICK
ncbi:hypothetical protein O9929_03460 [Vibrio lentus]|nr:hypothetical protein [Vibrio lentus]